MSELFGNNGNIYLMVARGDIYINKNNVITLLFDCRSDVTIRQNHIIKLIKENNQIKEKRL